MRSPLKKLQRDTRSLMHSWQTPADHNVCGRGIKESLVVMDDMTSFITVSFRFFLLILVLIPFCRVRERVFFFLISLLLFYSNLGLFPSIRARKFAGFYYFPFRSYKPHRQELPLGRSYLVFLTCSFFLMIHHELRPAVFLHFLTPFLWKFFWLLAFGIRGGNKRKNGIPEKLSFLMDASLSFFFFYFWSGVHTHTFGFRRCAKFRR